MSGAKQGHWQPYRTGMEAWQVRHEDILFACRQLGLATNETGFVYPPAGPLRTRFFIEMERAPREIAP